MNTLTLGQAKVGKIIGQIQAAAGSIGTSELATNAVTTVKITNLNVTAGKLASRAVTDGKRSMTWSTLGNTTKSVTSVEVSANGGYLITNTGSSKGLVVTGSTAGKELSIPAAGDFMRFNVDSNPGSTRPIHIKSTAATFDGTNKVLQLTDDDQFATIEAASTLRWVITSKSTGVTLAATT